jgi:protocatechuate 3,4-dioxygenase beta subunit
MNKIRFLLIAFLGFVFITGLLVAQVPTGKIIGKVTDNEGTFLPGVTVEATSPKLVGKASAVTDVNGIYRLLALPPGTYKIQYTLQGFNTVVRGISSSFSSRL